MNKRNIKNISSMLAAVAVITGSIAIMSEKKPIDKSSVNYSAIESSDNSFTPVVKSESEVDTAVTGGVSGKINAGDIKFETVKDEIWHKMLNTSDYYDSVSGKMLYSDGVGEVLCIDYQSDLNNSRAYTSVSEVSVSNTAYAVDGNTLNYVDSNGSITEVFTDSDAMVYLNNTDKTVERCESSVCSRRNDGSIDDSMRVVEEEDGTLGYYYRANVTNTYLASASLLPQEMTFGFLTDFDAWDVDGIEEYAGRECYVVSGKADENYGQKLGVEKFTFYIDRETGVLLKYVGCDESQNIRSYIITENISFDNIQTVYKPDTTGYSIT